MNDINEKKETDSKHDELREPTSDASKEIFYKKLGAYLLLLYQSYLKKETRLEAETKGALLRMVKFDQDYAIKIRMMQLDHLNEDVPRLTEKWDESKDILFPIKQSEIPKTVENKLEKTITEYKNEVALLLRAFA